MCHEMVKEMKLQDIVISNSKLHVLELLSKKYVFLSNWCKYVKSSRYLMQSRYVLLSGTNFCNPYVHCKN